jgi:hypothetical protein
MKKRLSTLLLGVALAAALPPFAAAQPQPAPPPAPVAPTAPVPPALPGPGALPAPPAPAPTPPRGGPVVPRVIVTPGAPLGPVPPGRPLPPEVPPGTSMTPPVRPPGTPLPPQAVVVTPQARTYTPGEFDSIEISGSADVRFSQGATDQVTVRGDDDDVQRTILLDVRNGRLRIDQSGSWRFWDSSRVRIDVQARDLARVSISGAGDFVATTPVRADTLLVSISGAGSARFERLDAQKLSFQISGKGDGRVAGTARELAVKISGHGEFAGENLRTETCDVQVSGVGNARIWTVEQLRLSVAGVGKIDYWGMPPQVLRKISGAATINDRGAK